VTVHWFSGADIILPAMKILHFLLLQPWTTTAIHSKTSLQTEVLYNNGFEHLWYWGPSTRPNKMADPTAQEIKQSVITHITLKSVNMDYYLNPCLHWRQRYPIITMNSMFFLL